jgi:putative nucleotidyltransferase with HDIG domain
MVSSSHFIRLNNRYRTYLKSLAITDPVVRQHVDLKVEHTYRVISNSMIIARRSGLCESDVQLARIIALVHDIGRYQQFMTYRTFDDSLSVNHAQFGLDIARQIGLFDGIIDGADHTLITRAIMNHNLHRLAPLSDERLMLFSRLIRDADKVDIWYILSVQDVVNTILDSSETQTSYEVPDQILQCFRKGQSVRAAESMNDYRFLRLSWIYDMNYPATFALIRKRGYVDRILARIPPSDRKDEIAAIIHQYVEAHHYNLIL